MLRAGRGSSVLLEGQAGLWAVGGRGRKSSQAKEGKGRRKGLETGRRRMKNLAPEQLGTFPETGNACGSPGDRKGD